MMWLMVFRIVTDAIESTSLSSQYATISTTARDFRLFCFFLSLSTSMLNFSLVLRCHDLLVVTNLCVEVLRRPSSIFADNSAEDKTNTLWYN